MNCYCCCCCRQAVSDAVASWEEGKRWQNKVESLRSALKEKENEVEKLKKQVSTVKELLGRCVSITTSTNSILSFKCQASNNDAFLV